MRRILTGTALALVLSLVAHAPAARAQYIQVYSPPVLVAPPPVATYSYYPPATSYYAPSVSYYPPATSYYAPSVSYYEPTPTYSYYPATTVYAAPPAVVTPSVVTTRSFVGLGIFRPRGVYTQTYVAPAPGTTTYYYPR